MLIEFLEPRRLLASYALGDFFPSKPGYVWDYSGKSDTQNATDHRTVAADTTAGANVRFDDNIVDSNAAALATISRYYNLGAGGAFLCRQDAVVPDGSFSTEITFKTPLRFLNNTINDGDKITWSKLPLSAEVDESTYGHITGTGTDTGSSTVKVIHNVALKNGKYIPTALQVTIDHTESYSGTISGIIPGTVTAHIVETIVLAPGIGQISGVEQIDATIKALGQTENITQTANFSLVSSNLLPTFTASKDSAGILNVTGTSGRDLLAVTKSGSKILVSNGAPTQSFNTAGITGVAVFALDGNDQVTVSPGVGTYVDAGPGNDKIQGGAESDTFTGGAGKDSVYGGDGDDRLNGNNSPDQLFGEAGNDRLYGGDSDDVLDGGGNIDRLFAGLGNDVLIGGGSNDKLYGEDGNDLLIGNAGADLLDGGPGSDQRKNDPLDFSVNVETVIP